jgi:hypothetical protein
MKYRIAMWAAAGSLVAGGWALYYFGPGKDHPVEPIVSALTRLTCPVAIVHYPVSVHSSFLANAATYALAGLVVETLRRQFNRSN